MLHIYTHFHCKKKNLAPGRFWRNIQFQKTVHCHRILPSALMIKHHHWMFTKLASSWLDSSASSKHSLLTCVNFCPLVLATWIAFSLLTSFSLKINKMSRNYQRCHIIKTSALCPFSVLLSFTIHKDQKGAEPHSCFTALGFFRFNVPSTTVVAGFFNMTSHNLATENGLYHQYNHRQTASCLPEGVLRFV